MPLRVSEVIASEIWAITPEALNQIVAIANRENDSIEAVEARLGRTLDNARTVTMREDVAVIPITGPIFRYANLLTQISGATSLEVMAQDFQAALLDSSVQSIVLNIDSPGGMAAGIAEFAEMVRESSKPVIAYVDNQAASAAYWIASAADEIVMSKTGQVGSVGVVLEADIKTKEGSVEIVSSQSPKKRPDLSTQEGRDQIQARIDAMAQVFIDDVALYRGVSVETVLANFGQGDIRLGVEAVDLQMADRVSTFEKVIAGLSGKPRGESLIMSKDNNTPAAEQPVINREYLNDNHADLVAAIKSEGFDEGIKAGSENERKRVQQVMAQSMPGHEKLIEQMAFDGASTGGDAAMAVLNAEKNKLEKIGQEMADNAVDAVPVVVSQSGDYASEDEDESSQKSSKEIAADARVLVDQAEKEGRTLSYADAVKQVVAQH